MAATSEENTKYEVGALSAYFGCKSKKRSKDRLDGKLSHHVKKANEAFWLSSKITEDEHSELRNGKRVSLFDSPSKEQAVTTKPLKRKRDPPPDDPEEKEDVEKSKVEFKTSAKRRRNAEPKDEEQIRVCDKSEKEFKKRVKRKKNNELEETEEVHDNPKTQNKFKEKKQKNSGSDYSRFEHKIESVKDDHESRVEHKIKYVHDDPEKTARTLFVGNLPLTCKKKKLIKLFKQFGKVESVRFRSSLSKAHNNPKKAVFKSRNMESQSSCLTAYVVMTDYLSASNALDLNGSELDGHRIRVDCAGNKDHEHKKSVFVGNLPYDAEEDELWAFFQECGMIRNIRLIRDATLKIGKGFGYVSFDNEDGILLALQKNGQDFKGRSLRIFPAKSEKQLKKSNRDISGSNPWRTENTRHRSKTKKRFKEINNFVGLESKHGRQVKKKIIKNIRHPWKRNRSAKQVEDNSSLW